MGTAKTASSVANVEELRRELAEINAQLQALTSESYSVSEAAVRRLSIADWQKIRMSMVEHDRNNQPVKVKGENRFKLVKTANPKTYSAIHGLINTLRSRAQNGLPVELSATLNSKGRSQIMFAQEVLTACVNEGFVNPKAAILQDEPKVRASKKSSK
jgi:hypothetical protein